MYIEVTNCRRGWHGDYIAYLCRMIIYPGQHFPEPFPKGAILLVDKPLTWTSFDVVNKVRYFLSKRIGQKKLKIGHAGTLDPLATGLLILCVGDFTKRIEEFQAMPKTYEGTFTLGATTLSFDLEKAPDQFYSIEHLTEELLESARLQFIGDIDQIPPVFSAVKVDGRRLYKNARTGEEVELPQRRVRIERFDLTGSLKKVAPSDVLAHVASKKGAPIMLHPDYPDGLQVDFRVVCSKGTYIRSLAKDFGESVQSGAYLSRLVRTGTGGFELKDAWRLEDLVTWIGTLPQL